MDDNADFAAWRRLVPTSNSPPCNLEQDKADDVCTKLLHLWNGGAVVVEAIGNPINDGAPPPDIPLTQEVSGTKPNGAHTMSTSSLTQLPPDSQADDDRPPKKLRAEPPLTNAYVKDYTGSVVAATKAYFLASKSETEQWRANALLKDKNPGADGNEAAKLVTRMWREAGLGSESGSVRGAKQHCIAHHLALLMRWWRS